MTAPRLRGVKSSVPADFPAESLAVLLEVSAALAGSLDLATVLQTSIESAVQVLGLETGAIYTLDGERLFLGATTPPMGPGFPAALRSVARAEHPHIDGCLTSKQCVYLEDARTATLTAEERVAVEARGLRTILYVPLLVQGEILGACIVGSTSGVRRFAPRHLQLASALAVEIGLAVANAQLVDRLQRAHARLEAAYDATIAGWAHALEMRDASTRVHAGRVAELTLALAVRLGVPAEELPHIHRGALLHDIGKMVVPDAILNKPGPLGEAEWAVMREHPRSARQLLAEIEFLAPALAIPECHHERWDGSGYPAGLRAEAIPFAARIFAVADVFDALTSDRPYRPAWPRAEALAFLRREAGRLFDPVVVEALLSHLAAN
jgi:HD-GYP domain-containing protein (c-di-GMP phosphodiesterase class II)